MLACCLQLMTRSPGTCLILNKRKRERDTHEQKKTKTHVLVPFIILCVCVCVRPVQLELKEKLILLSQHVNFILLWFSFNLVFVV